MSRCNLRSISFDVWAITSHDSIWLRGQKIQICHHCNTTAAQLGYQHSFPSPFFLQSVHNHLWGTCPQMISEMTLATRATSPSQTLQDVGRQGGGGQSAEVLCQRILSESPRQRWSLCPVFPWQHRRSDDSQHSHTICSGPGE